MKNRNIENRDDWQTPDYVYNSLDSEFHFDFDPCPINPGFDGLDIEWGDKNFVNPPYSRKLKEAFITKAIVESKKGRLCVMLLPVSTSTRIFHDHILPNKTEIRFLRGRIKFKGFNTFGVWTEKNCGMHDSMVVIFGNKSNE